MRLAALFLLSALSAFANACVGPASAGTVNWHTAAWTSCGGTFPGSGDTAQLSAGTTMVCETGQTCTVGTSPASAGANALSAVADNIAANLTVNGTLVFRGPVLQCHLCDWRVSAGGALVHDSSLSASPVMTHYVWHFGIGFFNTAIILTLSGTSGSHVTVSNAAGSGYSGGFTTEFGNSAYLQATYTDFVGCGSAKTLQDAGCLSVSLPNTTDAWVMDHVTADATSGSIYSTYVGANASITFQYTNWLGHSLVAPDCGYCDSSVYLDRVAGWVSGTRLVKNSNFSRDFSVYGNTGDSVSKFTFTDSMTETFYGRSLAESGNTQTNVVYYETIDGGAPTICCSNTGLLELSNSQHANIEVRGGQNQVIDGAVVQSLRIDSDGHDLFQVEHLEAAAAGNSYTLRNILFLLAPDGTGEGTAFNYPLSTGVAAGATVTVDHGTYTGVGLGGAGAPNAFEGVGGENNNLGTGMFTWVRDNILWRPAGVGEAYLTGHAGAGTPANASWGGVDYNSFFRVNSGFYWPGTTSAYYGTPSPPGPHDITSIDPNWVDRNRIVVMYDQQYLGRSLGTAWSNGTTYAIGNIASNTHSGYWSSQATNWTCVKAVLDTDAWPAVTSVIWAAMTSAQWALLNSAAGTTEPGVGTNWQTFWEPAAVTEIRNGLIAGTTKADGAIPGCTVASPCSASALAAGWARRGYTPRNPVIRSAGHDGLTVGAVPMDPITVSVVTP